MYFNENLTSKWTKFCFYLKYCNCIVRIVLVII